MSANTETTGTDRTKCKAPEWCGINTSEKDDDSTEEKARTRAYLSPANRNYGERGKDRKLYCSPACRDARLPPIAAPAAPKIEVKATVDGKCPLCGTTVPATHIHLCGAAPAAHVERRKGQRWRFEYRATAVAPGIVRTFTLVAPCEYVGNQGWNTDDGHGFVANNAWDDTGHFTMTLLADTPPEPAKPEATTIMDCAVKPGWSHFPGVVCECKGTPAKLPPAQEAPKAAPVCERCKSASGVLMTGFDSRQSPACSLCRIKLAAWVSLQTGKPYAGPERLPRPRLAADWVEDCLPESGR